MRAACRLRAALELASRDQPAAWRDAEGEFSSTLIGNSNYQAAGPITRPDIPRFTTYLVFLDRYAALRPIAEESDAKGRRLTFLRSVGFLHPERTPFTLALLAAARGSQTSPDASSSALLPASQRVFATGPADDPTALARQLDQRHQRKSHFAACCGNS